MDEFNVEVPSIEYAAYQTLSPDYQAYKTSLDIAEASKDESVTKFSMELEVRVDDLNAEVAAIRLEAQHEKLLRENSHFDEVIRTNRRCSPLPGIDWKTPALHGHVTEVVVNLK
eukprot:8426097-Pyramimonas_sp.AAC.1